MRLVVNEGRIWRSRRQEPDLTVRGARDDRACGLHICFREAMVIQPETMFGAQRT